jgi:hypothetical protein
MVWYAEDRFEMSLRMRTFVIGATYLARAC